MKNKPFFRKTVLHLLFLFFVFLALQYDPYSDGSPIAIVPLLHFGFPFPVLFLPLFLLGITVSVPLLSPTRHPACAIPSSASDGIVPPSSARNVSLSNYFEPATGVLPSLEHRSNFPAATVPAKRVRRFLNPVLKSAPAHQFPGNGIGYRRPKIGAVAQRLKSNCQNVTQKALIKITGFEWFSGYRNPFQSRMRNTSAEGFEAEFLTANRYENTISNPPERFAEHPFPCDKNVPVEFLATKSVTNFISKFLLPQKVWQERYRKKNCHSS